MAVSGQAQPNLSPSYENILSQLQTRTGIAERTPTTEGAIGSVLNTQAGYANDRSQVAFKASLEDQLAKNRSQYEAQAEGKTFYDQPAVDALVAKEYPDLDPKYIPQVGKGIWASPKDLQELEEHGSYNAQSEKLASQFDKSNPTKASLLRFLARDKNNAQMITRVAGFSKPTLKISPADGMIHAFDEMSGQDLGPVGTGGSNPAIPTRDDMPGLRTIAPLEARALEDASKNAFSDPIVKKNAAAIDALHDIKDALEQNNPTQLTNIKARLAQESGGVPGGRFSAMLSQGEGFDPSFVSQLDQWAEKKTFGDLTEHNKKLLLGQVDQNIQTATSHLKGAVENHKTAAQVDAPHASDKLLTTKIAGSYSRYLTDNNSQGKTVKRMKQDGKFYDVTYDSNGKYVSSIEVK